MAALHPGLQQCLHTSTLAITRVESNALGGFLGQQVVQLVEGLADAKGYVPVRDTYQSSLLQRLCCRDSGGVTVPWTTAVPVGVPRTGFPTEIRAHVAATNVAAQYRRKPSTAHKEFGDIPAICVMDAGNSGVLILATRCCRPARPG